LKTKNYPGLRFDSGETEPVSDSLTVEAALQVSVNGLAYTTTMRTPGEDLYLVRGLLYTEGIVTDLDPPIRYDEVTDPATGYNVGVAVSLSETFLLKPIAGRRSIASTSSCGICGTRELSDIEMCGPPLESDPSELFDTEILPGMMAAMSASQCAFNTSGGCHAAAVFTLEGNLLAGSEDVGRHNAVDKVIGRLLVERRLHLARCLMVSGRVSYEIVLKGYRAGIPYLMAVSAPSSLAVESAERHGMTVLGFCRDSRATVYSNPEKVKGGQAVAAITASQEQT
jgi:FdhD protein